MGKRKNGRHTTYAKLTSLFAKLDNQIEKEKLKDKAEARTKDKTE